MIAHLGLLDDKMARVKFVFEIFFSDNFEYISYHMNLTIDF